MFADLSFIWSVRLVKVARQLLPEINEVYESLVEEWGEDCVKKVLDIRIYITEKDRSEAASFRAQIRDFALFKSKKVVFIRAKFDKVIEEHAVGLSKYLSILSVTDHFRVEVKHKCCSNLIDVTLSVYSVYTSS